MSQAHSPSKLTAKFAFLKRLCEPIIPMRKRAGRPRVGESNQDRIDAAVTLATELALNYVVEEAVNDMIIALHIIGPQTHDVSTYDLASGGSAEGEVQATSK